ncbi:MAG: S-layer homology domain-containing protein [Oscillospiraceae bacterium]|nr:S-layer homology domain-containing protein [Oscillospiraceae bacterium]
MKKKVFSIFTALVMLSSALPFQALAHSPTVSHTAPLAVKMDETSSTPTPPDKVLAKNTVSVFHPSHLASGETSISNYVIDGAGPVSFTKGNISTTGSVQVSSWDVTREGLVSYTFSSAKAGDTITFPIIVHSTNSGSDTFHLVVTIGYDALMITSATTVTYGTTLTLTCDGLKGSGAVFYTVTSNSSNPNAGDASVSGNILTPKKVGEVTVIATQVKDANNETQISAPVTITITKATPTGKPTCTEITRAGQTLGDSELKADGFSVPGRVEWKLSSDTIAVANVEYEWVFTPEDSINYTTLTGSLTPYVVTDPDFAIHGGTTVLNRDGSYTTTSFGEDDSTYRLTEYLDGSKTMVHKKADGTVTTTELDTAGTRTQTIENPDGSKIISAELSNRMTYTTSIDHYGYTTTQVSLPSSVTSSAVRNDTVLELPIPELPNTDDRADAPTITLSLSVKSPIRVSIPINSPSSGTVAVLVHKNGAEELIKSSTTAKDAVLVTLDGSATLKIFDNSKNFLDVSNKNWFHDAADFVTSRGLFQGMNATTFAPNLSMSRAMLVTVLHNLADNPIYGYYAPFVDAKNTWYSNAAVWATANGYITGYPDGTFRGDDNITREQLAVILYRYAGYPSSTGYLNSALTDYSDYRSISNYAMSAMYWAACSGVLYTSGKDQLAPQRDATRAEVAQSIKNLVEYLAN